MTTYVFPGQGSQSYGMGKTLFSEFPDIVQKANEILGYSVLDLCLKNPNEQLNQTQYTQPALYVVNALHYMQTIREKHTPDYVAGHSLGEYNALLAAQVFDFETGLKLVQKRGQLMSQAVGGGMAAVIGLKSNEIEQLLKQKRITNIKIANYNSYSQTIISGLKNEIEVVQPLFEEAGASLFLPLKVSGAFHSSYMQEAQQQFSDFLQTFIFNPPVIPIIANVNAKPYQAHEIRLNLAQQIVCPVQWTKTIEYLLEQNETDFVEIGPGTVLSGLIERIKNGK